MFQTRRLFAMLWAWALAPVLSAQVINATLTGIVTDPTGAAVTGASVRAINTGTNSERNTVTNSTGGYTIPELNPGTYRIEVEQTGFKRQVLSGIVLQVAQTARINVTLEVGQLAESVTVEGAAPLVNSENAMIGSVIAQQRVVDLPLNGRNFMQLTLLTGGINEGDNSNSQKTGILNKGFAPSAAGMPASENNYQLDGADNKEAFFHTFNVAPSVDAVQEFNIQIGQYSAEFGAGGGAVVNVVTKSGTNEFHGAAWEFVRNSDLDARNFFLLPNQPIAALHQNQFGIAAGGPIIRNKTFIFGDFDLTRIRQGQFGSANVPTSEQVTGNLSGFPKTILDPSTSAPFPGNIIPPSRINPVSANLAKFYPQPNSPNPLQNFSNNLAAQNDSNNYLLKVDHIFSERQNLMGRYASQGNSRYTPGTFPAIGGQRQPQRFQNALVRLISTLSPNLLNEAHFSYSRAINRTQGQNTGTPVAADAGVPFAFRDPLNAGFPERINIGSSAITGFAENQPWFLTVNSFQWYDGITWIRGSHTLKAGADVRRNRGDAAIATHANNDYTFSGQFTGDGFADFLLGYPSSETLVLAPNQTARLRNTEMAVYALDDWKLSPKLTLNFGLRYEYNTPPIELSGLTSLFNPATGGLLFPEQGGSAVAWFQQNRPDIAAGLLDRQSMFLPDRNNLAPRFGFAWRPWGKSSTVVRGGYGIFYSSPPILNLAQNAVSGPPAQLWANYASSVDKPTLTYGGAVGVPTDQALRTATFGVITGPEARFLNAYTQEWNLGIGKQIAKDFVFDVEYLGSKSTHIENLLDYNATTPAAAPLASRVPYPKWSYVLGFSSGAAANYHALMLNAEKRMSHGLTFKSSYTYSKALSKAGGRIGGGFQAYIQNPLNTRTENARSDFDMSHRFVTNFTYQLPFGAGKPLGNNLRGFVNHLVGGWTLGGIVTAESGLYLYPGVGGQNCNNGYFIFCRPDLLRNPFLGGSGVNSPRWSQAAFDWPYNSAAHPVQPPRLGSAGSNILPGNGLVNFDLSLRKDIPIREQIRFEFRFESFNAFNHANFGSPVAQVDSPQFGRTYTANPPRLNQLGLKLYW